MEITPNTYIDTLQRLKIVSSSTRNKCIDRAIFAIKDLEQYLDYRGRIVLRGFSDRSIIELQNAWDKANGSSAASSSANKPRRLTRILSQEEKSTISELEDLFENTYMGGCTVEGDNKPVSHNTIAIQKKTIVVEEPSIAPVSNLDRVKDLNDFLVKLTNFLNKNPKKPSLQSEGEELELATRFEYMIKHKNLYEKTELDIISTIEKALNSL